MINDNTKSLCLQLIRADSEKEVIDILSQAGYWEDEKFWRFYSDYENNFNTIGNQQSSPDAALIEKIINAIDARLMNECLAKGIDPESPQAPQSIIEAVAVFFDMGIDCKSSMAGRIKYWQDNKRKDVAKGITVAATGFMPSQGNLCLTISDCGEGQTPKMMPNTFLSTTESNKLRIPFVQGKFNMGGTGVLKFCGKHNLQLIVTKRNPILLHKRESSSDDNWGFTIVRREDPRGNRRSSVYSYLAPIDAENRPQKGEVLSFYSNTMSIFPEGQDPYARESQWGTLVKLYEYTLSNRSNIIMGDGLLRRIDLLIPNIALPIRLYECRKYRGHAGSFETTVNGLSVRLEDDRGENIESPWSFSLDVSGEKITGTIYLFKQNCADTYRKNEGIIFTINGQTHGYISNNFFKNKKIGLSYLANSLLVIIDCSNISGRAREDLFMNSRDRLSNGSLKKEIEMELAELLKKHAGLREQNEARRREAIESVIGDSKPLENVLESILKKSPILSKLFIAGERLSNPFKTKKVAEEDKKFIGNKYPTYFKFKNVNYGESIKKDCHINMRCRVFFETDARNDYFSRDGDNGTFSLYMNRGDDEVPVQNYSINLNNGIATLSIKLPNNCEVGDNLQFTSIVCDPTSIIPFINKMQVNVKEEADPKGKSGKREKPPGKEKGNDREIPQGISLPEIQEIFEEQWDKQEPPFDKYTALRIKNSGSGNGEFEVYDYQVNMDNIYLKNELKNSSKEADLVRARFKFGMVLIGLALIKQDIEKHKDNSELDSETIEDKVEDFTKAIAPILLPMIDSLGTLDLDEIEQDYSSEAAASIE